MNKRLIAIIVISFILLFISYLPDLYEASQSTNLPNNRIMLWGEHNYTYDFNVYLSKIRQGLEGRVTVIDKYDNDSTQTGVFLQMLYVFSGKIFGIFNFTPTLIYHLIRILASCIWILTIIYFNLLFFKKSRDYIWGILLSLLSASFPIFTTLNTQFWIRNYMEWWQELDVMRRISYIPHYSINYITITILTALMINETKNKSSKNFVTICIILFISIFIHPAGSILFIFSWLLYHLLYYVFIKKFTLKELKTLILKTITLSIVCAIPLLYIKNITSVYPWKTLIDFDQFNRVPMPINEYILALGPVFFTGILGMIVTLKVKNYKFLALMTWVIAAFIAICIFTFFPDQSQLRFVQTANHIPLAILSVYFFQYIINKYRNPIVSIITYTSMILIVTNGIVHSYFSIMGQIMFINQRVTATLPLVPYPSQVMYPLKDFYNGLNWLKNNTSRNSVVLSKITAGNYIPAYSGNYVYLGHSSETPHFEERNKIINIFYSGAMDYQNALSFIKQEKINYIFYGPQEKENDYKEILNYSFLFPVFKSQYVNIFQVKN